MSSIRSSNRAQTTTTGSRDTLPVGAWAGGSTKAESSTTLRLRSASLSKLGAHQSSDVTGQETRLASLSPYKATESDQIVRLRSQQANQTPRDSFRSTSSRLTKRVARSSRYLRLNRSRRTTFGHFERQLERVLTTLIGPSVIVGRSLTNKIFANDHHSSTLEHVQEDTTGTKHKLVSSSHPSSLLGALIAPIIRTLHCLILFFVNFLQYHLLTLRQFLARIYTKDSSEKVFLAQFANGSQGQANGVTAMRAQRKQRWPATAGDRSAYSFDATHAMAPHEFASPSATPTYSHHNHRQSHHQSSPMWTVARPTHVATGHVHRHNHTSGLAASAYHRPKEELLMEAPRQVRDTFVSSSLGQYRSLECDTHEPSCQLYANHMHPHSTALPFVCQQQQQVIAPPPTRGHVPTDTSQMWKWHMRRTIDGYPSSEEPEGFYLPVGGSFDHQSAEYHQPGHLQHANQSAHGFPAHTLAGMPHRQRLASISSPTLSDYDNLNCWPGPQPAVDIQPASFVGRQASGAADLSQPTVITSGGGGSQVSNHQRNSRRQLPQPPSQDAHTAHQCSLVNSTAKRPDRRLSSIMGSDSELYTAKRGGGTQPAPTSGNNCNSSDDTSVSSASRSRANANLIRFQLGKQAGYEHNNHQYQPLAQIPPEASPNNWSVVNGAADRRRFTRQASGASAASPSCANSATVQRAGAGDRARRAHGTPKLPHQFNSLQADSPRRTDTDTAPTAVIESPSKAPSRLTKSDTESKSPKVEGQPARTGSDDNRHGGRPTSAKPIGAKSLAAGGKSKSVMSAHPSPIGVLGKAVSLAGAKRRLGFKQKGGLNSLSVHRSEEYFPAPRREPTGGSGATTASNSLNSDSCEVADPSSSSSAPKWLSQFGGAGSPDPRVCFVEGLGAGQIASRQALVSPYLGDVQVSLSDRRGMLEVEIIRVRQLQPKPGAKRLPSPYVKVYLMRNKKCAAKFKTRQLQQTLDPLYQQLFIFRDSDYSNCVLQIIVWADYGKKDRKSLMGIVQIHLDDLDMSQTLVIGWYKLFNAPSMVAATASAPKVASSSKALRQTLSSTKLGDLATIQRQKQQVADLMELPPVESQQQQ